MPYFVICTDFLVNILKTLVFFQIMSYFLVVINFMFCSNRAYFLILTVFFGNILKKRVFFQIMLYFLIIKNFMFCSNHIFFLIFTDFLGYILKKRYVHKTIRTGFIQMFSIVIFQTSGVLRKP